MTGPIPTIPGTRRPEPVGIIVSDPPVHEGSAALIWIAAAAAAACALLACAVIIRRTKMDPERRVLDALCAKLRLGRGLKRTVREVSEKTGTHPAALLLSEHALRRALDRYVAPDKRRSKRLDRLRHRLLAPDQRDAA